MASTGGLFGGAQQKTGSSLFGSSTAAATAQPGTGGGLFGGGAATAPTEPARHGWWTVWEHSTADTTGAVDRRWSLWYCRKPATTTERRPLRTVDATAAAATTADPAQWRPFGSSTATAQPATGGGLFGQSQASQAKPSGGLFGQSQAAQSQPTSSVPAVQINYDNLRPRTRFDDLAQPVQDEIALIDKGIQRVIKMKDEIGEFMPQHERDIEQLGRDVKFVESKFRTVQVALNRDIQTVKVLQDMTKKNITDAQLSFKATDNLKLPTHYHQTGLFAGPTPSADSNPANASSAHASAQDLITYFNRICDDVEKYKKRLDEYRAEIERDMPGVENGLYEQIRSLKDRHAATGGGVQDQLTQVLSALRETGNAIVTQAGQIADTRERLSRLQAGIVDSGVYALGTHA
ncbi:hypothetical protein ACCO45_005667 [Purpureocillium lilacinum]|uniref:Uncharacterized protein n=1 Tax=Purpureocillium lilacinum TaxID=33203 RepID=A0ACC4DW44_PURLI